MEGLDRIGLGRWNGALQENQGSKNMTRRRMVNG
jgi:hypothetical protein